MASEHHKPEEIVAKLGLVVISLPEVPIWKAWHFNNLCFAQYGKVLIYLDNKPFVSMMLIRKYSLVEHRRASRWLDPFSAWLWPLGGLAECVGDGVAKGWLWPWR